MKTIAVVLLAGFLMACDKPASAPAGSPAATGPNGPTPASYTVNIIWKDGSKCEVKKVEEPDTTCKKNNDSAENDEPALCVRPGDFIVWQSNKPSNAKFAIFFDPLKGGQVQTGSGTIRKRIDDKAPEAYYKYSIVRDGCEPDDVNTFDPRIRVDH